VEETIELRLLTPAEAIKVHGLLLDKDGGLQGVRDLSALSSALQSPRQHLSYRNPQATLPELAAVMAYEVVKFHPFADGNKRTAAVLIVMFMRAHGIRWRPRRASLVQQMVNVARSRSTEEERERVIAYLGLWIMYSQADYA
jgi:death-on-curing protein